VKHVNVSLFVPHLGCPHRCVFCDQTAISGAGRPITKEEIVSACETAMRTPHEKENAEIAFFGGSFTAVDRSVQRMCLEAAAPYLETGFSGIRVSTRPDAVDNDTLCFLKQYGVTAVELGAQSMDNAVLALNERGHTAEATVEAAKRVKAAGFSLGLQMMTGLPGSADETDIATARRFIELRPDTVRIYPTVVLKNTALARMYEAGEYTPPSLGQSVALCAQLLLMFQTAGIPVIRLGLHSGGSVDENYVAGPYHPAFRELCEAEIYKTKISALLSGKAPGAYTLLVSPGHASKAAGQKRSNLTFFSQQGYRLKIAETPEIPAFQPQTLIQ
jgi:histone acetyltransferase (RNA polymerase elongator complex component)